MNLAFPTGKQLITVGLVDKAHQTGNCLMLAEKLLEGTIEMVADFLGCGVGCSITIHIS